MRDKAIAFTPVVRSVILESAERLLPNHRDAVTGEIADKDLALAVAKDIDTARPEIATLGRAEAWPVGVYQGIREFIRHSTGSYVVHHHDHKDAEKRARARQRRMVTFRDHTGKTTTKDRIKLRKDEIPLVRTAYERVAAGAGDVIEWCDAVMRQMTLLGLGDDALVESVVECPDGEEGTGTDG